METFRTLDLDQIRLPRPLPGPLPLPKEDQMSLVNQFGLQALPRMRVVAKGTGYELVSGIQAYRIAVALQIMSVDVEVGQYDPTCIGAAQKLDFFQNEHRLSPIQQAQFIQSFCKAQGITRAEFGRRMGMHKREVSRLTRLLSLPKVVQQFIEEGSLQVATARCLLPYPAEKQLALAREAVSGKWTTQQMEAVCRGSHSNEPRAKKTVVDVKRPVEHATPPRELSGGPGVMHMRDEEARITDTIGSPTQVLFNKTSKVVEIVIRCANVDVYEGVQMRLLGDSTSQGEQPIFNDDFHI